MNLQPRSWVLGSAMLALASFCGSASAGLLGSSVTVTLDAPAMSVNASDTVTVTNAVEFGPCTAGPGCSNVGSNLLTNGLGTQEFIDLDDFTISLRLVDGDNTNTPDSNSTGWGAGAKYVFSGLNISGQVITGASITGQSGFTNFSASWLTFDSASQLSLDIGTMRFSGGDPAADDALHVGLITITLQTQACTTPNCNGGGGGNAPEPGTLLMVAAGLLAARRVHVCRRAAV